MILNKLVEMIMGLFKNHSRIRISPQDSGEGFLVEKIVAGENVSIDVVSGNQGDQLRISAILDASPSPNAISGHAVIDENESFILVDASKEPVVLTLPPAKTYIRQLKIVCADASHGISIITNPYTSDTIFDTSNLTFHAKGDAYTLVANNDTWYIIGRYVAAWYA